MVLGIAGISLRNGAAHRTVPKGFGTPRAEAARVHRAPGRTTTAGPNNNQPPRQESTAQEQPTAQ